MLSHELFVGVKYTWKRGWRAATSSLGRLGALRKALLVYAHDPGQLESGSNEHFMAWTPSG
jgi:hypothetical protein